MSRRAKYDTAPHDELGMPAGELARCPECRRYYPEGGWHKCSGNGIGDVPADARAAWEGEDD